MNSAIMRLLVCQGKRLAVTCGGRFHVVWLSKSEVAGSSPRLPLDVFNLREPSKPGDRGVRSPGASPTSGDNKYQSICGGRLSAVGSARRIGGADRAESKRKLLGSISTGKLVFTLAGAAGRHLWEQGRRMRLRIVTIRLAALLVLLTSFADYWAYDRWDPTAPMNSCGSEAVEAVNLHPPSAVHFHSANLQDDRCVCCSPVLAPPAPVVPQSALRASSANELACGVIATSLRPLGIPTSPPLRGRAGSDRPLRI